MVPFSHKFMYCKISYAWMILFTEVYLYILHIDRGRERFTYFFRFNLNFYTNNSITINETFHNNSIMCIVKKKTSFSRKKKYLFNFEFNFSIFKH